MNVGWWSRVGQSVPRKTHGEDRSEEQNKRVCHRHHGYQGLFASLTVNIKLKVLNYTYNQS